MPTFTNQATLSYNDTITNSNIATGQLLEVLSATKTAVTDTYGSNDKIAYVVSIVNSGTTPYSALTVTDDLGGYDFNGTTVYPLEYVDGSVLYYVDGVLQPTPTVTAGPPLAITGISIPAGGNVIIIYEAETTGFAPLDTDGTITNEVTVSGSCVTAFTATETVTAVSGPVLTVTKTISPETVTENSRVTYTFTIQNTGNTAAVATDDVTLTDVFDPILTDIAVTFNGAAWSEPENYTYDEATGTFATVPGQITVPAATFEQDPTTGAWITTPGVSVLTVTGTI